MSGTRRALARRYSGAGGRKGTAGAGAVGAANCGVADTAILDPRLYPLVIGERVRDKIAKTQPDVR